MLSGSSFNSVTLRSGIAGYKLLIIDELGFVPLSKTGAELVFEMIPLHYERGCPLITRNPPFDEFTETFGTDRHTSSLRGHLTQQVSILEMCSGSNRLALTQLRMSTTTE